MARCGAILAANGDRYFLYLLEWEVEGRIEYLGRKIDAERSGCG